MLLPDRPCFGTVPRRRISLGGESRRRVMFASQFKIPLSMLALLLAATTGCSALHHAPNLSQRRHGPPPPPLENPLTVPPINEDYLWNQLVDSVDDYFKIEREDRISRTTGVVSEGRIETYPEVGSSLLEPWRRDSTPGPERMLATLQSIRRRCLVRVTPSPMGYQIFVTVLKELEDVSRPEFATVGGAMQRHDGSVVRTTPVNGNEPVTLGWIPIGRDYSLEQQILHEMKARLQGPPPRRAPGEGLLHH